MVIVLQFVKYYFAFFYSHCQLWSFRGGGLAQTYSSIDVKIPDVKQLWWRLWLSAIIVISRFYSCTTLMATECHAIGAIGAIFFCFISQDSQWKFWLTVRGTYSSKDIKITMLLSNYSSLSQKFLALYMWQCPVVRWMTVTSFKVSTNPL